MIEGTVNHAREAIVSLPVSGPAGRIEEIEAVIDTGYNGYITVPPALVSELRLPFVTSGRATLANGSEDVFDIHDATVLWGGAPLSVLADAADTVPLVGMALLEGHSLHIDVRPGGSVVIQASGHDRSQAG